MLASAGRLLRVRIVKMGGGASTNTDVPIKQVKTGAGLASEAISRFGLEKRAPFKTPRPNLSFPPTSQTSFVAASSIHHPLRYYIPPT